MSAESRRRSWVSGRRIRAAGSTLRGRPCPPRRLRRPQHDRPTSDSDASTLDARTSASAPENESPLGHSTQLSPPLRAVVGTLDLWLFALLHRSRCGGLHRAEPHGASATGRDSRAHRRRADGADYQDFSGIIPGNEALQAAPSAAPNLCNRHGSTPFTAFVIGSTLARNRSPNYLSCKDTCC